ncbi:MULTISPECIES: sugar dehydrogenase complex small subunit [Tatumella]|uniref:Sugar dehydrogenase complex small subunit n=1 Tax=Tatumella punctata TaxID=399969 RepID=A0ABW1VMY2_9GAMM|nr:MULTISPECIES: sugar dehydrogenase complex small subunit [unclassified Tatumella]MBS0857517.1 sorbitol dehydrogenase [Tatumella sp. JGM16]MBS0876560.1 sorbitol dehydrogenase [Tatumella sp. JGM82]MBS0890053.1 sorbitol dehydrogenase [Tatumella sp. JGM94]MBS0901297.1 sorbitol dehydrogenase [Tatumella sp. JGM100]MBS0914210.1 sorbitol dehydrogenase [Tatumella sp. JGM91]
MSVNNHPSAISRRRLLQGMGILSVAGLCGSLFPAVRAAAAELHDSGFIPLSEFLVNRRVNPLLAARYYDALHRHDDQFPRKLALLQQDIRPGKYRNIDPFLQHNPVGSDLRQAAAQIISAWYTGVVGSNDKPELIAYAEAMMYLPARGILVVPTYGSGPLSWAAVDNKPAYQGPAV